MSRFLPSHLLSRPQPTAAPARDSFGAACFERFLTRYFERVWPHTF